MDDQELWEIIYRALVMVVKAIARYKLHKILEVTTDRRIDGVP